MKLTAVSCAPVVEVKIKRPDTKYQLGFSVQNGVVSQQHGLTFVHIVQYKGGLFMGNAIIDNLFVISDMQSFERRHR